MPRPVFPSLEPAAAPRLHPAHTGINRSGFHWLPRDWGPVCGPHGRWQPSTSPFLALLCTRPGSLHGDGNHCILGGLRCFSLVAPGNAHCCCQLRFHGLRHLDFYMDPMHIMDRECHFIKMCHSSFFLFFLWGFVCSKCSLRWNLQVLHPGVFYLLIHLSQTYICVYRYISRKKCWTKSKEQRPHIVDKTVLWLKTGSFLLLFLINFKGYYL